MSQFPALLTALSELTGVTLRLWEREGERWSLLAGPAVEYQPDLTSPGPLGPVTRLESGNASSLISRPPGDWFLELGQAPPALAEARQNAVCAILRIVAGLERSEAELGLELRARYEEIDLLYSIGQELGQAKQVPQIAHNVLLEVARVAGARRAGLRVYDPLTDQLEIVALIGEEPGVIPRRVSASDPAVLVARAFKAGQIQAGPQPEWVPGEVVTVPIIYATADAAPRPIGTISLADRIGGGSFAPEEVKILQAIGTQIGAALENARLINLEIEKEKLSRELEMVRLLQLRLMPPAASLGERAEVAISAIAAESLGGDFYTFQRLTHGRVGVMLGDVSSHGFEAALVAAQVISMAGVHVDTAGHPELTLAQLRNALGRNLTQHEMYVSLFLSVFQPEAGLLSYCNAGHPHAFRIPAEGAAERLGASSPALGLYEEGDFQRTEVAWEFGSDLLALFTDGFVDQPDSTGRRFGERRMVSLLEDYRTLPVEELKDRVLTVHHNWGGQPVDDCTLVLLRI